MQFGSRRIEAEEPVMYFEKISIATLQEKSSLIMARGGWANSPRVTWEDRSEVSFQMMSGVMSQLNFGIMLDAEVAFSTGKEAPLEISTREGPFELVPIDIEGQDRIYGFQIKHIPVMYPKRKVFIFEYARKNVQKKIYGKFIRRDIPGFGEQYYIIPYKDKDLKNAADTDREYVVDYYYEYGDEALIYTIAKERFNGLFSLEGKFYSKDENEGLNCTNLIYMPKVRIVSNIDLRLGERADPAVSTFNIVGIPEFTGKNSTIVEITRLGEDIE